MISIVSYLWDNDMLLIEFFRQEKQAKMWSIDQVTLDLRKMSPEKNKDRFFI